MVMVTDQGGTGSGAILSLSESINRYGQIVPSGPDIVSAGESYSTPIISVIADPNEASPTQQAELKAHLTHPEGEVYVIKLADLNATNLTPEYSVRISERKGSWRGHGEVENPR